MPARWPLLDEYRQVHLPVREVKSRMGEPTLALGRSSLGEPTLMHLAGLPEPGRTRMGRTRGKG